MIGRFVRSVLLVIVGFALLGAVPTAAANSATGPAPSVRRFALIIGANNGGRDRVTLRYAGSDADAVSAVLHNLGGVRSGDHQQHADPSPEELERAFAEMRRATARAQRRGERVQFLFYYSGHSDEKGLLLAGDLVTYKQLRRLVKQVPADVRIAILDSCASGAFTRLKGGTKRPPFLSGSATKVKGHAFLTSSSEDEAAQESDRVRGSFFTHYLTTGLRGAADQNGDRLITLNEAYRFAFDATLARTESTGGGPQHAAYDIQLAGSGDLVMTDLRRSSARLEIAPDVSGRIFVRNAAGQLAAELDKPKGGAPVRLALEPGRYQVTVDGRKLRRADVRVLAGGQAVLKASALRVVAREKATLRGSPPREPEAEPEATAAPDTDAEPPLLRVPFNLGLVQPVSLNGRKGDRRVLNYASLALVSSRVAHLDGVAFAIGATVVDEDAHGMQAAFGANIARQRLVGMQSSMLFNHAKQMRGVQFSMFNHAQQVDKGVQLGLANVAKTVRGVQFGLVNYAEEADASIGVLTITKKGGIQGEAWQSDTAAVNIGLRLPAKYTYSFLGAGLHPFGRGRGWQFGGGFGGHIPLKHDLYVEIDVAGFVVSTGGLKFERPLAALAKARARLGWQPRKHLGLFAGPTFNVLADDESDDLPRMGYGWVVATKQHRYARLRMWPGFIVGLRF